MLKTRPERDRAQLRDQVMTTSARLSPHPLHKSHPSQAGLLGLPGSRCSMQSTRPRSVDSVSRVEPRSVQFGGSFKNCKLKVGEMASWVKFVSADS